MDLTPNPILTLAQMVPFLVLIFALKSLVFNPLLDYLEERHRRIQGFAHDARDTEAKAERLMHEVEAQLAQARLEISESRSRLIRTAQEEERRIVTEARTRAETQVEEFRKELTQSQEEAATTLRAQIEVLSQDIASRVLGRPIAQS